MFLMQLFRNEVDYNSWKLSWGEVLQQNAFNIQR